MPEQPQWSERTLDMPPQDPWAEPHTVPTPPGAQPARPAPPGPPGSRSTPPGAPGGRITPPGSPAGPTAAPTAPFPSAGTPGPPPEPSPFSRGRAQVSPRPQPHAAEHEPTGTGWPGAEPPPARPMNWSLRELRRGGEWSSWALLFAFVGWGVWTISEGDDLATPIIVFILSVLVAGGLFALSRVLGHVILEKQLGRVRRSARGSHMVAAVFLVGVGLAHLQQTEWVMDAYHWVVGAF